MPVTQVVNRSRERPTRVTVSSATSSTDLGYLRNFKVAKVALGQGLASTYIFGWQNPESNAIVVHEVIIRVTTAAGAAATMNVGPAASAAATSATIFNALALVGTGIYSSHNVSDTGVTGNEKPHVLDENGGATDWLTGLETAALNYSALVGSVYIFYTEV